MPELTVHRKPAAPPPMVCMYCGGPATSTREWREENHGPVRGGGGADVVPAPAPPLKPAPTTLVVVTTCDRHRRFRDRFAWAAAGVGLALAAAWAVAVLEARRVMGTEDVGLAVALVTTAVFVTVMLPVALGGWYVFGGPVVVDRVTGDAVVLDRVRRAYFDATGLGPEGGRAETA